MEDNSYREKVLALMDEAKQDEELANALRTGAPSEIMEILNARGFTNTDVQYALKDYEAIANTEFRWWSW
ncbi:MAG: hypothetical protein ACRDHL_05305 [Candidatus Promineifilaceae bacterium]